MTFVVVVDGDAASWRVDLVTLTEAIRGRWADAEFDSTGDSEVRGLIWRFETENGPGEAYLHVDGTCLYMDVWEEEAVWLAIVFRRLTPADLDLIFCDEGYTYDIRLQAGATEGELRYLVDAAG